MKKRLACYLLPLTMIFASCSSNTGTASPTAQPASPAPSATDVVQTEEVTETPDPSQTPAPSVINVELPVTVSDYAEFLSAGAEAGVFYVEFDPNRGNALQLDRPHMPTYTWYLNGTEANQVGAVVIEFDLIETVDPLNGGYFGYDRGYFIGIHNFETIPLYPVWVDDSNRENLVGFANMYSETDRDMMLLFPELAVDMQKYLQQDGNHYKFVIPYSEFQNAPKDLTLQFLPGTTFGDLRTSVLVKDGVDPDILYKITQPIENNLEGDVFDEVVLPFLNVAPSDLIPREDVELSDHNLRSFVHGQHVMREGLVINPDGSISMPVSMYDLGEYADEVQGEYAVVPEGLVSVFMVFLQDDFFADEQRRQIFDFVFENMVDENGQFSGVYDIEQGKMVATDRKVPALPILSAMLLRADLLTDAEIDLIMNSIIASDIVRVDDKLYYVPNGLSDDGVTDFKLSDFTISANLFDLFVQYEDEERLDGRFGGAMLMEGYTNSLQLILEGQEQNPTRLPSSELKVIILEDGGYELQPSETFSINDPFFSMGLLAYDQFDLYVNNFGIVAVRDQSNSWLKTLENNQDGAYNAAQEQTIRETTALYSDMYNALKIVNTYYQSYLDIYNFMKIQPASNRYASGYNVNTGEIVYVDVKIPSYEKVERFAQHFGSPSASLNWLNIAGMLNDEKMVKEAAHLTMINYDLYVSMMFPNQGVDYRNPDVYADHGFNIWGYDSLKHIMTFLLPGSSPTRFTFSTSGLNFNRENPGEFVRRKLNEVRAEGNMLTKEDTLPLFYDHLPSAIIVK